MSHDHKNKIYCGQKVLILYPEYTANSIGIVVGQEEQKKGSKTGYWLIQVELTDMIFALTPDEFMPLPD